MKIETWKTCPVCSDPLSLLSEPDERVHCSSCSFTQYRNPVPSSILVPINEHGQILLLKRNSEPMRGSWSLVGGFLNINESSEEGAVRECFEEIRVTVESSELEYMGSYSSVYGSSGRHTISNCYLVRLSSETIITLNQEECSEYKWYDYEEIPTNIAFEDCRLAIKYARKFITRTPEVDLLHI